MRDRHRQAFAGGLAFHQDLGGRALVELEARLVPPKQVEDLLFDLQPRDFLDLLVSQRPLLDQAGDRRLGRLRVARQRRVQLALCDVAPRQEDLRDEERFPGSVGQATDVAVLEEHQFLLAGRRVDPQRPGLLVHGQVLENVGEAETFNASLETHGGQKPPAVPRQSPTP
ncbi:MAG: hypothetical protein NTW87_34980 [Planctomycetota bacterium]|nr:hypothetical protein [Planctomycetota bacterium]